MEPQLVEKLCRLRPRAWEETIIRYHAVEEYFAMPNAGHAEVRECASRLGVNERTFYRLIADRRKRPAGRGRPNSRRRANKTQRKPSCFVDPQVEAVMATLQQQLAASRLGDVELRGYFTQLCESLGASMIHDHDQIAIAVTADRTSVNADVSVSLGLIVTELVINALKHAFPGERSGKILVDYHAHGPDWTLSVSDDGVGTPEALAAARPGLGTSIVEALANQLDATVETEGGYPGTTVSVSHTELSDA